MFDRFAARVLALSFLGSVAASTGVSAGDAPVSLGLGQPVPVQVPPPEFIPAPIRPPNGVPAPQIVPLPPLVIYTAPPVVRPLPPRGQPARK